MSHARMAARPAALAGYSGIDQRLAFRHAPDGSLIQAPLSLLERTPFADFLWPGIILGGMFGLGSLLAGLTIKREWRHGFRFAQVIGAGHVVWILFQLHWFDERSFLQPALASLGLAIFVLAEFCRRRGRASGIARTGRRNA